MLRRQLRLVVERIDVREAASEEDDDEPLGFGREMSALGSNGTSVV
jgi:hypothetical protein